MDVTVINPWSFTVSCSAIFLKHSFCLWVPHCEYLSIGVFTPWPWLLWYFSTCIPHWATSRRSNIVPHPLKEHEGLMFSYESKRKIYIPFRWFLFSIMETNQQGEKTKHMEFDLWINEYHLPCAVISAPFKNSRFYLWLMFSALNFVNVQHFFSEL